MLPSSRMYTVRLWHVYSVQQSMGDAKLDRLTAALDNGGE